MKDQYVQTCDCCGERFSSIQTSPVPREYCDGIPDVFEHILNKHDMHGVLSTLTIGNMVIGFNYTYANKKETKKAQLICEDLVDGFNLLCAHWIDNCQDQIESEVIIDNAQKQKSA
jgi:hypothetical protein